MKISEILTGMCVYACEWGWWCLGQDYEFQRWSCARVAKDEMWTMSGPTLEILNGEYMGGSAQDSSNPHMLAMCYHSLALTLYELNFSERT